MALLAASASPELRRRQDRRFRCCHAGSGVASSVYCCGRCADLAVLDGGSGGVVVGPDDVAGNPSSAVVVAELVITR